MARPSKWVVGAAATFWILLTAAAPALASAKVDGVNVYPVAKCFQAGLQIGNSTGADIEARLYENGSPALPGNPWIAAKDGFVTGVLTGTPVPGATYEAKMKGPGNTEVSLGTTVYTQPDYCDDFKSTYVDMCDGVKVTLKNNHGSDVLLQIIWVSGATHPIKDVPLIAGETQTHEVAVDDGVKIGIYFHDIDYVAFYDHKAPKDCPSPPPPPSQPASPGAELPVTGTAHLPGLINVGTALLLAGAGTVLIARRRRA